MVPILPEHICGLLDAVGDDALEADGGPGHHMLLRITVHRHARHYNRNTLIV